MNGRDAQVFSTVTLLSLEEAMYTDTYDRKIERFAIGDDPLIKRTVLRLAEWVESDDRNLNGLDLELLGSHLYRYLFGARGSEPDDYFQTCYRVFKKQQRENSNLRLRLTLAFERAAMELAQLPWEFLVMSPDHDESRSFFVANLETELVLTRCILPTVPAPTPPKPLRIMVILSSPPGEADLETTEMLALLDTIQKLDDEERVAVKIIRDNPRFSGVRAELAADPAWHPDVFHFIGHGRPGEVAVRMEKDEYVEHLARNGERSYEAAWIKNQSLLDLFPRNRRPRLVFLHACDSATRPLDQRLDAVRDAAAGLTDVEGIQAIIAMRYPIASDTAAAFAQRFYQQIGLGVPIDLAVAVARKALAEVTSDSSWGRRQATPLLYLQTEKAVILEAPVAVPPGPRFLCPYEQIGTHTGGGFVTSGQRTCRVCQNRLVWCANGHPNTTHDVACADCELTLEVGQIGLSAARGGAGVRVGAVGAERSERAQVLRRQAPAGFEASP